MTKRTTAILRAGGVWQSTSMSTHTVSPDSNRTLSPWRERTRTWEIATGLESSMAGEMRVLFM